MSRGRPSGLELDDSSAALVSEEVVRVDERGRIKLPLKLVKGLPWLIENDLPTHALAIAGSLGQLAIHKWELANDVLRVHKELSAISDFQLLSSVQAKYARVNIARDLRLTLGSLLLLHLDIDLVNVNQVVLARFGESIEIQTSAFRQKAISNLAELYPELPR